MQQDSMWLEVQALQVENKKLKECLQGWSNSSKKLMVMQELDVAREENIYPAKEFVDEVYTRKKLNWNSCSSRWMNTSELDGKWQHALAAAERDITWLSKQLVQQQTKAELKWLHVVANEANKWVASLA